MQEKIYRMHFRASRQAASAVKMPTHRLHNSNIYSIFAPFLQIIVYIPYGKYHTFALPSQGLPHLEERLLLFLFSPKPLIPGSQHASTQQRFCLRLPQLRKLVPMQSGRRGFPTCLRPPQPLQKEGLAHLLKGVLTLCLKGYDPFAQRGKNLLPKRVRPFCPKG